MLDSDCPAPMGPSGGGTGLGAAGSPVALYGQAMGGGNHNYTEVRYVN
jgi:hypothetical protein